MALVRLNTRSLPDSAVTTAKVADNAVTTTKLFADNLGRRNLLINGNFDVWQRATSFTDVAGIWKYGHADRWNGHNDAADAGTYSQSTVVPNAGSNYSMLLTGASGVSNTNFSQRIESADLKGIREKDSFTVSGYARSAIAGKNIGCHALCPTATDNYAGYSQHGAVATSTTISGNGGTGTSSITLTDANTWYYFTFTKTSATSLTNFDKGYALFLAVNGQNSTSHQVYLSQLQVEAGTTATPFEQRSFAEEIHLCKRFYQKTFNYATAPENGGGSGVSYNGGLLGYCGSNNNGTLSGFHRFDPEMRTTPTITQYGNSSGHWGRLIPTNTGTTSFSAGSGYLGVTKASGVNFGQNVSGDTLIIGFGHLTADAEL